MANLYNLTDDEMKHLYPKGITELINNLKWRLEHNRCTISEKTELRTEISQLEELLVIANKGNIV